MLTNSIIAKKLLLNEKIELCDFIGKHFIGGVEFDEYLRANRMTLVIDDIPFGFIEDEDDGYRSMLDCIEISDAVVKNTFDKVLLKWTIDPGEDILFAYSLGVKDMREEKACVRVGTDLVDSYYPTFLDYWAPENYISLNDMISPCF